MPEFRGNAVTNERLLANKTVSKWKSLALLRTRVDDDGLIQVCQVAKRLEEVHIVSDQISDTSMPALCSLPLLRSLLFDGVPRITDVGIASIANSYQLRELYLNGTQLSDAGVDALSGLPQVWSLSLIDTKITDTGVSKLGSLQLVLVRFERVRVEGWGLQGLQNTSKMRLFLDGCPISDKNLTAFLATHNKISTLSLNNSNVGNPSIVAIADLQDLEDLRLEGTTVTDEGVKTLLRHPTLLTLYLKDTMVSEQMVQQLKSESPEDLIVFR